MNKFFVSILVSFSSLFVFFVCQAATVDIPCNLDGTIYSHTTASCSAARDGANLTLDTSYIEGTTDYYNNNYEIERGFGHCDVEQIPGWPDVSVSSSTLYLLSSQGACVSYPMLSLYQTQYASPLTTDHFTSVWDNNLTDTYLIMHDMSVGVRYGFPLNASGLYELTSGVSGFNFALATDVDIESEECTDDAPCYYGFYSSTASQANRPFLRVVYGEGTSTPEGTSTLPVSLHIGDPVDCCEGSDCYIPVSFNRDLNNTTLSWTVDPSNCNALLPDFTSVTMNFYAIEPTTIIATSTASAGSHNLCVLWNNGEDSAIMYKSFDVWESSSTICSARAIYEAAQAKTAHDRACTSSEWNAPDPTLWDGGPALPAFNLVKLKCYLFEGAITAGDMAVGVYKHGINFATGVFPINIFYHVQDSFNDAPNTSLPSAVSFLDFTDEQGDVHFVLPALFSLQQGKRDIIIFGPSLFSPDATTTAFFAECKEMSRWFIIALFFAGIILSAISFVKSLSWTKPEDLSISEDE